MIDGADPNHIIFTLNCSDALNLAIKGAVRPGNHVICTAMDHNSVLRPLHRLSEDGLITTTRVPCDPKTGLMDPQDLRRALRPETRLVAVTHGSNVTGTVQDLKAISEVMRSHKALLLVDAAQTLGHLPISVRDLEIDLLAAPGHKGLLGPLGTGFLYLRPGLETELRPLREGGTGSVSESDQQPEFMPDKFEPGSHNTIGLAGLDAALAWIAERGIASIAAHEHRLMSVFLGEIAEQTPSGLHLYGPTDPAQRCAVFSVRIDGFDRPQDLSDVLEQEAGVLSRSGLHCAPGAHETLGTAERGGTTRVSFGPFCTEDEVRSTAQALVRIAQSKHPQAAPCSTSGSS